MSSCRNSFFVSNCTKGHSLLSSILGEAVLSACERACSLIDMNAHEGIHPCMGAVDLVPLYPLGEEVGLEDCGKEARGMWPFMQTRHLNAFSESPGCKV